MFHQECSCRVRTKTVKKAARLIVEKYYPKLTVDFQTNKRICSEVALIPTKRLRNKIAGFVTHLMRRIARGPVRGISLKLQEEERERRDNYTPDETFLKTLTDNLIITDQETQDMLNSSDFPELAKAGEQGGKQTSSYSSQPFPRRQNQQRTKKNQ